VGVVLDALAAPVELVPGQGDDVGPVHHRHRLRECLDRGVLVAAEAVYRDDLNLVSELRCAGSGPVAMAAAERPGTMSKSRAGPWPATTAVRSVITVTKTVGLGAADVGPLVLAEVGPLVLVDPDHADPVESGGAGGQQ
jgi:hypothetical protein